MTNKKAIRAQYHGNEDKGMDIMIVVVLLELATLEHTELSSLPIFLWIHEPLKLKEAIMVSETTKSIIHFEST